MHPIPECFDSFWLRRDVEDFCRDLDEDHARVDPEEASRGSRIEAHDATHRA
jgi:hypothetical protein